MDDSDGHGGGVYVRACELLQVMGEALDSAWDVLLYLDDDLGNSPRDTQTRTALASRIMDRARGGEHNAVALQNDGTAYVLRNELHIRSSSFRLGNFFTFAEFVGRK